MMHPAIRGVPRIPFNGALNLCLDGNSLIDGQGTGGGQTISHNLARMAPIAKISSVNFVPESCTTLSSSPRTYRSDKGVIVYNVGISGQNWLQMNSSAADVDGTFNPNPGIFNVLGVMEGTNTIVNFGYTWQQAVQYAKDYATARRLAHPWNKLFIMTCLPRMNQSTNQTQINTDNANLDAYNAYLLANYKAMGYDAVVDVRQPGTYFDMGGDYSIAHFNAMASASDSLWATSTYESPSTSHVHLNSNGYWYLATLIMPVLRRMTRR